MPAGASVSAYNFNNVIIIIIIGSRRQLKSIASTWNAHDWFLPQQERVLTAATWDNAR